MLQEYNANSTDVISPPAHHLTCSVLQTDCSAVCQTKGSTAQDPRLPSDKALPDAAKANLGTSDKLTVCLHSPRDTDSTQAQARGDGWRLCVYVCVFRD